VDERQRRLGLNEAVFREVNERIEAVQRQFDVQGDELDLLCECGSAGCTARISMPRHAYEQLRADAGQFAVVPGHGNDAVEAVVAHEGAYDVIRKRPGEPTRLAQQTDPRDH
jgi:hypothetical protein